MDRFVALTGELAVCDAAGVIIGREKAPNFTVRSGSIVTGIRLYRVARSW